MIDEGLARTEYFYLLNLVYRVLFDPLFDVPDTSNIEKEQKEMEKLDKIRKEQEMIRRKEQQEKEFEDVLQYTNGLSYLLKLHNAHINQLLRSQRYAENPDEPNQLSTTYIAIQEETA